MSTKRAKTPPPAKFKAGEFIVYKAREDGFVERVQDSKLGYNLYHICLLSGQSLTATLPELSTPTHPIEALVGEDQEIPEALSQEDFQRAGQEGEMDENHDKRQKENEKEKHQKGKKRRFAEMTDENLDELAMGRLSKGTVTQTAYGVKVFKGRWMHTQTLYKQLTPSVPADLVMQGLVNGGSMACSSLAAHSADIRQ
jgi:hypothetical protein